MASCFFLLKQFDDVNIYLSSVKAYMYNDDGFNWNHGNRLEAPTENLLYLPSYSPPSLPP